MITRRHVLAASVVLSVTGCATAVSPAQIATDTNLVVNSLSALMPSILALSGVPAATAAKISVDMAIVKSEAPVLTSLVSGQAIPATDTKAFVLAVNDIFTLATTPPLSTVIPPQYEAPIAAVGALLPVLEAEAGITSGAKFSTSSLSPDEARVILRASAVK